MRSVCICVSINGPRNLDLFILKLVGNLHSEFGHAMPLGSQIIRYVCDRRTEVILIAPFPMGRGIIMVSFWSVTYSSKLIQILYINDSCSMTKIQSS